MRLPTLACLSLIAALAVCGCRVAPLVPTASPEPTSSPAPLRVSAGSREVGPDSSGSGVSQLTLSAAFIRSREGSLTISATVENAGPDRFGLTGPEPITAYVLTSDGQMLSSLYRFRPPPPGPQRFPPRSTPLEPGGQLSSAYSTTVGVESSVATVGVHLGNGLSVAVPWDAIPVR